MFGSFASIDELWQGSMEYIWKFGKEHEGRDGKNTKELLGPVLRLVNTNANLLCHVGRFASPIYAAGEFMWYLSGRGDGDQICHYAPSYRQFIEDDGKAHGSYGRRFYKEDQIRRVILMLRDKPETRQAVIDIWRSDLDLCAAHHGTKKDIPCTLSLQFLVRDGQLNCICTMRSNDIWLGLPYDIFCFTTLQNFIASQLAIPTGFYQHQPGSLHLYQRNWDLGEEAIGFGASPVNFHFEDDPFFWDAIEEAKRIERELRILNIVNVGCFELIKKKFGAGSRWGFLLALCVLQSDDPLEGDALEAANELIPEIPLTMAMHLRRKRMERAKR
jgi:thymidylate synthase